MVVARGADLAGRLLAVVTLCLLLTLTLGSAGALAQGQSGVNADLPAFAEPGDVVVMTGFIDAECEPGSAEVGFTDLSSEEISDDFPDILMTANKVILARPEVIGGEYSLEIVLPEPDFADPTLYAYCVAGEDFAGDTFGAGSWGPYLFGPRPGGVELPPGVEPSPGPVPDLPDSPTLDELAFQAGRPHVVSAVPTAADAPWSPASLLTAALIAGALVFLILFPSELFNSTFEEHHDEILAGIRRRLPMLARRQATDVAGVGAVPALAEPDDTTSTGPGRRGWVGFLGISAGAALLYGLLDPGFGANKASLVLVIGVGAGIAFSTVVAASTSGWLARRRFGRADYWFKVLPATLLVAALFVAVSRLVGFLPGYLYGLVGGIAFRKALAEEDEARVVVASTLAVLSAAVFGWLLYGVVADRVADGSTGLGWLVAEAILAGTFIAGVEGLLFGLLPLKYLSGEKLLSRSRALWVAVYLPVVLVFVHLIARPAAAEDPSAVDWTKTLSLFVAFGAGSVAFWAYWRRRDQQVPNEPLPEA